VVVPAPICVAACCLLRIWAHRRGCRQDESSPKVSSDVGYTITFAGLSVGAATLNAEFRKVCTALPHGPSPGAHAASCSTVIVLDLARLVPEVGSSHLLHLDDGESEADSRP